MGLTRPPPSGRPRVALVLVGIGDLAGSGGAERIFSDLHEHLRANGSAEVSVITDRASLQSIQRSGRLHSHVGVIALALHDAPMRTKARTLRTTAALLRTMWAERFDLVHLCLPTPNFVPFVVALNRLPAFRRPSVALSVIDCTLASSLEQTPPAGTYERQVLDAHRMYFRWTKLDGIYSWYQNAVDTIGRLRLAPAALLRPARYCFTNTKRFAPAEVKENVVVFAGRLSEQKRPLLFVDAIARLRHYEPELASGLRVEMYGKGVLEQSVRERIALHGLEQIVVLTHTADMAPVFARSRLFVSTQAIENFTSLAMLEAMAAGNAIVAAAVGQTREFVRDSENGLLVREETAEGFAAAIAEYMRHPERHDAMAAASRVIATDVHTVEHFADDIVSFWSDVIDRRAGHA